MTRRRKPAAHERPTRRAVERAPGVLVLRDADDEERDAGTGEEHRHPEQGNAPTRAPLRHPAAPGRDRAPSWRPSPRHGWPRSSAPGRQARHRRRAGRGLPRPAQRLADPRRDRRGERTPVDASRAAGEVERRDLADRVLVARVADDVERRRPGVLREAALAAGMHTIAVCRVPGAEATLAAAHRVVDSLSADTILDAA